MMYTNFPCNLYHFLTFFPMTIAATRINSKLAVQWLPLPPYLRGVIKPIVICISIYLLSMCSDRKTKLSIQRTGPREKRFCKWTVHIMLLLLLGCKSCVGSRRTFSLGQVLSRDCLALTFGHTQTGKKSPACHPPSFPPSSSIHWSNLFAESLCNNFYRFFSIWGQDYMYTIGGWIRFGYKQED